MNQIPKKKVNEISKEDNEIQNGYKNVNRQDEKELDVKMPTEMDEGECKRFFLFYH